MTNRGIPMVRRILHLVIAGVALCIVGCTEGGNGPGPGSPKSPSPLTFTSPVTGASGSGSPNITSGPSGQAGGLGGTVSENGGGALSSATSEPGTASGQGPQVETPAVKTPPVETPPAETPAGQKAGVTPPAPTPSEEKLPAAETKKEGPASYSETLFVFKAIQTEVNPVYQVIAATMGDFLATLSKDACTDLYYKGSSDYEACWSKTFDKSCNPLFWSEEARKECAAVLVAIHCKALSGLQKKNCAEKTGLTAEFVTKVLNDTVLNFQEMYEVEFKVTDASVQQFCNSSYKPDLDCQTKCARQMALNYACNGDTSCLKQHFSPTMDSQIKAIPNPSVDDLLYCDKELAPDVVAAKMTGVKALASDKAKCPSTEPGTFNMLKSCGETEMQNICWAINPSLQDQCQATVALTWCKWNSNCMKQRGVTDKVIKLALQTAQKEAAGSPDQMLPYMDANDQAHSPLMGGGIPNPFGDWTLDQLRLATKNPKLSENTSSPRSVCVAPPLAPLGKNTNWITGVAVRAGLMLDDLQFGCNKVSFQISPEFKGKMLMQQSSFGVLTGGWMKKKKDYCDVLKGQKGSWLTPIISCDGAVWVNHNEAVLVGFRFEPGDFYGHTVIGKIRFIYRMIAPGSSTTPMPGGYGTILSLDAPLIGNNLLCSATIGGENALDTLNIGNYILKAGFSDCNLGEKLTQEFVCPGGYVATDVRGGFGELIDSLGLTCTRVVQPFLELKNWGISY